METLSFNITKGKPRRVVEDGVEYLVCHATSIVPGVLHGSRGALYYPPHEIKRSVRNWDRMPLTLDHPYTATGEPVHANWGDVPQRQWLGHLRNSHVTEDGKLKHECWFNVEDTKRLSPYLYDIIKRGQQVEVSTGLHTENMPAQRGATYNGKPFDYIATNYRPDHLAVLINERGACSIQDGCGIHNKSGFHRPENYDKVKDLAGGKQLWAGANDWENGWTWAGIHGRESRDSDGYLTPPEKWIEVSHKDCPYCHGTLESSNRKDAKGCSDYGKQQVAKWAGVTLNVWSDEARQASIEARNATHSAVVASKALGRHSTKVKIDAFGKSGEPEMHKRQAANHESDAKFHDTQIGTHHDKVAAAHRTAASLHREAAKLKITTNAPFPPKPGVPKPPIAPQPPTAKPPFPPKASPPTPPRVPPQPAAPKGPVPPQLQGKNPNTPAPQEGVAPVPPPTTPPGPARPPATPGQLQDPATIDHLVQEVVNHIHETAQESGIEVPELDLDKIRAAVQQAMMNPKQTMQALQGMITTNCGGQGGKPGPCATGVKAKEPSPKDAKGTKPEEPAKKGTAARLWQGVKDKFNGLRGRYGLIGAIGVMGAWASPILGAGPAATAAAEGVRAVVQHFTKAAPTTPGTPPPAGVKTPKPEDTDRPFARPQATPRTHDLGKGPLREAPTGYKDIQAPPTRDTVSGYRDIGKVGKVKNTYTPSSNGRIQMDELSVGLSNIITQMVENVLLGNAGQSKHLETGQFLPKNGSSKKQTHSAVTKGYTHRQEEFEGAEDELNEEDSAAVLVGKDNAEGDDGRGLADIEEEDYDPTAESQEYDFNDIQDVDGTRNEDIDNVWSDEAREASAEARKNHHAVVADLHRQAAIEHRKADAFGAKGRASLIPGSKIDPKSRPAMAASEKAFSTGTKLGQSEMAFKMQDHARNTGIDANHSHEKIAKMHDYMAAHHDHLASGGRSKMPGADTKVADIINHERYTESKIEDYFLMNCGGPGGSPGPCAGGNGEKLSGAAHHATISANEMSIKARASGTKEDHKAAAESHVDASIAHTRAAKAADKEGDTTGAIMHTGMASFHQQNANNHFGAKTRNAWSDAAREAAAATRAAHASSNETAAKSSPSNNDQHWAAVAHERASNAHDEAAQQAKKEGKYDNVRYHLQMRRAHDEAASDQRVGKSETGKDVTKLVKGYNTKNAWTDEARAAALEARKSGSMGGARSAAGDARIASSKASTSVRANAASDKADKASTDAAVAGGKANHKAAADAHKAAADEHMTAMSKQLFDKNNQRASDLHYVAAQAHKNAAESHIRAMTGAHNSSVENAWSEEARQAAIEARQASAKAVGHSNGMGGGKPQSLEVAAQRSKDSDTQSVKTAMNSHADAAKAHFRTADEHQSIANSLSRQGRIDEARGHRDAQEKHMTAGFAHQKAAGKTALITGNVWSEEARQAAIEARQASSHAADKTSASSGGRGIVANPAEHSNNEGSHDTSARAHENMAFAHFQAAQTAKGEGKNDEYKGHMQAAKAHDQARAAHEAAFKAGARSDTKNSDQSKDAGSDNNTTSNSDDSFFSEGTMTKAQRKILLTGLTANCSCDRDKAALNSLSDEGLQVIFGAAGVTANAQKCPKCGAMMEEGECPSCGYEEDETENDGSSGKAEGSNADVTGGKGMAQAGGKGVKEEYNKNSAHKQQSLQEWEATAPAEVKEKWNFVQQMIENVKAQKAKALVANIGNKERQDIAFKKMMRKTPDELDELLALMNTHNKKAVQAPPLYMGQSVVNSVKAHDDIADDDILALPSMNMLGDDAKNN